MHTITNGDPYPTEAGIRFFEDRARAGAALVTCAGITVGGAVDDGRHCSWDINKPFHTNRIVDMVARIHSYGAKCNMEIASGLPGGWTVSDGCTIMGWFMGRGEAPREVLEDFKEKVCATAAAIKDIGFDGIMLHLGHGNPIAQFLSPLTNKRRDEYGGSLENRCRFPKEVLDGIRAVLGPDMIIELRMSGSEYEKGGIDLEEGIRIAEILQENADIIQVSAGIHIPDWMTITHPCGFLPPLPLVHLAEAFKKSEKINKPVTAIGAIGSLAEAEAIISEGKADFVAMVRAFIADIDVLRKGLEERQEDVTPCVKCMRCHDSDNYARHMVCTVNPRVGMEQALERRSTPKLSKTVAVIGGGPAGIKAALTASELGHKVTLFEKEGSLGGGIKFADHVPFKYPLAGYKDFLIRQIAKSSVEVKLGSQARPEDLKSFDAVIAAVGATPVIPQIPGVDKAIFVLDVFGREAELGEKVVIIGGGEAGVETALHLARLGHEVTILEMKTELAPDALKTHRDELMFELRKDEEKLHIVLSASCSAIEPDAVTYLKDGLSHTIPADSVVLAAGMKALDKLADSFIGITDEFAQAGDCVRARSVAEATCEGYFAALNI